MKYSLIKGSYECRCRPGWEGEPYWNGPLEADPKPGCSVRIPPNAVCADGVSTTEAADKITKHFQYNKTEQTYDGNICLDLKCKIGYAGDPHWDVAGHIQDDRFKSINNYNDLEVSMKSTPAGIKLCTYN